MVQSSLQPDYTVAVSLIMSDNVFGGDWSDITVSLLQGFCYLKLTGTFDEAPDDPLTLLSYILEFRVRDEAQTACWATDECTKRMDRQTDESNDGESNSSASGVKAFPYEPGFKILGCQKNSHTWHNVRNQPNALNCNSTIVSLRLRNANLSAFKQTQYCNKHKSSRHVNKSTNWLLIQEKENRKRYPEVYKSGCL